MARHRITSFQLLRRSRNPTKNAGSRQAVCSDTRRSLRAVFALHSGNPRIQPKGVTMRRSEDRILTTHTGSLPRPPELTRLYVRRARGESVDAAEIDRLGRDALRSIVRKQAEAGVDIANNGEQQREGFFLHIRHRMS